LSAGCADVQAACRRCSSSSLLSCLVDPAVSTSFSAESLELVHGLKCCHLTACHFQPFLFLTNSRTALALLSTAPAFLQPKTFWNIWNLSDFLFFLVVLSFQWVIGHAALPNNEGGLAHQNRSNTLLYPCLQPPVFGDEIFLTTPSSTRFLWFLRWNWPFPVIRIR